MNIRHINTKYGMTLITNNSRSRTIYDDYGKVVDKMPKGIVVRYIPEGSWAPEVKVIPGKLTTDFNCDTEIVNYINEKI